MATSIQSIQWSPLGSQGSNRVATLILDATVDTLFNINLSGTATGTDDASNVSPGWLLIDNIKNNGYVTITLGNFTIQIPPYQRESIQIPSGTRLAAIQLNIGIISATLSEQRLVDNQSNALLVSQTSVKTLIYSYLYYNSTTAMSLMDGNSSILFSPTAANMEYQLLPVAGSSIGNGFYIRLQNGGNKIVTIRPDGGDTINSPLVGQFTNTAPLVLGPGDSGILTSDGFKWYYAAEVNPYDMWAYQPLGVPIPIYEHMFGVIIPPRDRNYRYIKLTASDTYNAGILTNQVVTGTFPLNVVTADIVDALSPFNGQSVNLINTERRVLRGGNPGVVEQDAFQSHGHETPFRIAGAGFAGGGNGPPAENGGVIPTRDATATIGLNGVPRIANETRGKNIGANFYLRIR